MEVKKIGPCFSFVLPAHNEAETVRVMTERLTAVGEALGSSFEVVWVDDGSTDATAQKLAALAHADARIRPVYLSRNFGHMAALTAGLEMALGTEAVVCMDADGQHPPELIPELVAAWREGADIVQTVKRSMVGETWSEALSKGIFSRLFKGLAGLELPQGAADFRLMSREVVDALNALPEHVRFVRGLVSWVGFNTTYVLFEAPARIGGKTKYSFWKLSTMALSGITSFSTRPLRLSFLLGAMVTAASALYGVYILWCFAAGVTLPHGWPSTLLMVLFLGGIQLMALGIVSEYLARLYEEVKGRPVYIVRRSGENQ